MSLKDDIACLSPNRRRFLLFRICDVDADVARKLVGIRTGTYNTWCHDHQFVTLYRRRDEYAASSKEEAIKLLRRDNQLAAVLLEEKIILRLKEEIDSGDYNLIRTNLAKEVYTKLINDLDVVPQNSGLTWVDKIQAIVNNNTAQITATPPQQLEVHSDTEASTSQSEELIESQAESEGEQAKNQVDEEDEA